MTRKYQIGVMASTADTKLYGQKAEKFAERTGELIAQAGAALVFGAEKDINSLSAASCRGAKRFNGLTIGVTYGKNKGVWEKNVDIVIASGLERGGGRETTLVLSCDAVIAISGGSGTLTELAIAYQADIPMIALVGCGGWADKMAGQYFDLRKRRKVLTANTPEQAVKLALKQAKKYVKKYG